MKSVNQTPHAPIKCSSVMHKVANDVNEHADNLTDWQQCYDQISSGAFRGSFTELSYDGLQVFHEYTSQQLHQRCNVWPDSIWLGIAANEVSDSRINGLAIKTNDVMCRPGSHEFELITPQDHDIYGIVIRKQELISTAETQGIAINWDEFAKHERLAIPESFMANLRFLLNRLLRQSSVLPGAKLQQDIIMMALLEVLAQQTPTAIKTQSYLRRKQVVDNVAAYLEANQDRPVRITELCQAVGACRRTLQYSFESIIGISPVQYLRATRLNGARRSLLNNSQHKTVADIAADWGFFHLSQFTKDYRELFGERPAETKDRWLSA
ncbi:helix-turn-helix domain-containing protein [Leucothrix sargassi]|nr:helix-turn-helix domain-containing protein [Leucothrix sargassi]